MSIQDSDIPAGPGPAIRQEGRGGYGIAISGAFAALTSLFISTIAGSLNRKTLLPWLSGLMSVSAPVVALAPGCPTHMIGRALIGVVVED